MRENEQTIRMFLNKMLEAMNSLPKMRQSSLITLVVDSDIDVTPSSRSLSQSQKDRSLRSSLIVWLDSQGTPHEASA